MAAHRGVRLGLCMLRRSWGGQHHSVNFLSSTAKAQARRAQTVPKRVDEVKAAPRARLAKISLAKSWDEVLDITALTPELIGYVVNERGDTFDLMTSDEYYEQLKASVESMRLKGDPFARQDMSKLPAPAVLHDLGCLVMEASRGRRSELSTALWLAAANARFEPSVLTVVWYMVQSNLYGGGGVFESPQTQFEVLVARKSNPIAMAIQGEVLFEKKKYVQSEKLLREILEDDNRREALGNWESVCRMAFGRSLLKLGKKEEAIPIFRELSEQGNIEAHLLLGNALASSDPKRAAEALYRAGCSGMPWAFGELAAIELGKTAKAKSRQEADEHRRWASEFLRLSDPAAQF